MDSLSLPISAYLPTTIDGYKVTSEKKSMADLIEREMYAAGFSRAVIAAAVTNSWAESYLNPNLQFFGPDYKKTNVKTEDSVGLFMLNSMGGHGSGMAKGRMYPNGDSRFDPVVNVRKIIDVMKASKNFKAAVKKYPNDAVRLTGEFTKWIELPSDAERKAAERMQLFYRVFPYGWEGSLESERDQLAERAPVDQESKSMPLSQRLLLWGAALGLGALIITIGLRQQAIKSGRLTPMTWPK